MTGAEQAEGAWDVAVVLMAAYHAISYLSLSSNINRPGQDMTEVGVRWLRRLLSSAGELADRRSANG
jgi:hypothetical protein